MLFLLIVGTAGTWGTTAECQSRRRGVEIVVIGVDEENDIRCNERSLKYRAVPESHQPRDKISLATTQTMRPC